jgi:MtN3 and saliva related transmembrane protein
MIDAAGDGAGRGGMMQELVAWLFGLGLVVNGALFVPQAIRIWRSRSAKDVSLITFGGFNLLQVIGIVHGTFQHDRALILGMVASLIGCGAVTLGALLFRNR